MSKRITLPLVALVAFVLVLGGVAFIRPQPAVAGSFNAPVLLIHGWNDQSSVNCNTGSMWGTVETYLHNQGYTNTRSLGFYNGDSNCDDSVRGESSHCAGWYDSGGSDGTVNEDLRHVSCLFAWYIWDHYTQRGTTVAVVAHSMGGLVIRQAMNDTPYVAAFPPYLQISDIATAGTPHQGLANIAAWYEIQFNGCPGNCIQVYQMQASNPLMSNMNSTSFRGGFARDPQGSGGTDWTTMASEHDEVLETCLSGQASLGAPGGSTSASCGLMPGATHFVIYPGPSPTYNHGGYLTDTSNNWDADEEYSDNNGGIWYTVTTSPHSILTMYYAILYASW